MTNMMSSRNFTTTAMRDCTLTICTLCRSCTVGYVTMVTVYNAECSSTLATVEHKGYHGDCTQWVVVSSPTLGANVAKEGSTSRIRTQHPCLSGTVPYRFGCRGSHTLNGTSCYTAECSTVPWQPSSTRVTMVTVHSAECSSTLATIEH